MLTLYYAPNTASLAPHIALEQAGADYRLERVDFEAAQQRSPDYLAVNPKGRVPSLVTDRGVLTETPAILLYLAQRYPGADMAPLDDPFELARVQAFNVFLCSTVHVAHAHKHRGTRWVAATDTAALEAMTRNVPQTMTAAFELIERTMIGEPWACGEQFGIADMYLFTMTRWLASDKVELARFPKVAAHCERMASVPAVQRVMPHHPPRD
ncbi:MAG: glutathione S-transferase family protein [Burkholderiaceae bacterium]|nr:glutathione S-transferase family protein [Burkholderiaceae bacterium]